MICDAHEVGYKVELCYVKVALNTALARNAARERVVPVDLIKEKAALLPYSLQVLKGYVDLYREVEND